MGEHRRTVKGLGGVGMSIIKIRICDCCQRPIEGENTVYYSVCVMPHPAANFNSEKRDVELCAECYKFNLESIAGVFNE